MSRGEPLANALPMEADFAIQLRNGLMYMLHGICAGQKITVTMAGEDDALSDSYSLLEAVSSAVDDRGAPMVDEVRLLDQGLKHGSLLEHVRDGRLDIVRVGAGRYPYGTPISMVLVGTV